MKRFFLIFWGALCVANFAPVYADDPVVDNSYISDAAFSAAVGLVANWWTPRKYFINFPPIVGALLYGISSSRWAYSSLLLGSCMSGAALGYYTRSPIINFLNKITGDGGGKKMNMRKFFCLMALSFLLTAPVYAYVGYPDESGGAMWAITSFLINGIANLIVVKKSEAALWSIGALTLLYAYDHLAHRYLHASHQKQLVSLFAGGLLGAFTGRQLRSKTIG